MLISLTRSVLIFRLILGEKRIEFAKRLGISAVNLGNFEGGRTKLRKLSTVVKYADLLSKIINYENFQKKANLETVCTNFQELLKSYDRRTSARSGGLKSVSNQSLNSLEKKVVEALSNYNIIDYTKNPDNFPYTFEYHTNVKTVNKIYNVDFVLPNKSTPKIILEVTKIKSIKYSTNIGKAYLLNSRFANFKLGYPNIVCFAIIESENGNIPEVFLEEVTYGKVINIENINEILSEMKDKLAMVVQPNKTSGLV